jgi:hypothetical protein
MKVVRRKPKRPWFHSIVVFFRNLINAFRQVSGKKPIGGRPTQPARPKPGAPTRCGDCGRLLLEDEEALGYCGDCVKGESDDDTEERRDDSA